MAAPRADVGAPVPDTTRSGVRSGLRVLRHRDFALLLSGQFVSNTGVWMHNVTVPFVLFQATGSATWVGFGGFAQFFPAMLAAPVGGVLADRFSRRLVLAIGSMFQAGLAFALAYLWRGGDASPWTTVALVAALGLTGGLVLPSWQSLVPVLVPRDDMVRAVSLNSTVFNVARAFGPALGGLVLARFGPEAAFGLNGASYLGIVGAVLAIRAARAAAAPSGERPLRDLLAGVSYARSKRGLVLAWWLVFSGASLGAPVMGLSAVMAAEEFGVGEARYGLLTAAVGLGAAVGGVIVTSYAASAARSRLATGAMALYGGSVVAFALAPVYGVGLVAMLGVGAGLLFTNTTLNTSIQLKVDDAYRGRVISLWAMGITGGLPTGSFLQGWLASHVGVRPTIAVAGGALVLVVLVSRARGLLAHLDPEP